MYTYIYAHKQIKSKNTQTNIECMYMHIRLCVYLLISLAVRLAANLNTAPLTPAPSHFLELLSPNFAPPILVVSNNQGSLFRGSYLKDYM